MGGFSGDEDEKSKGTFVSIQLFFVLLMMAGMTGLAAGTAEPAKTSQDDFQRLEGRWDPAGIDIVHREKHAIRRTSTEQDHVVCL